MLAWGNFLTIVLNFLIIAFVLFLVIKGINRLKTAEPPPAPAAASKEVQLLTDIRDALKNRRRAGLEVRGARKQTHDRD